MSLVACFCGCVYSFFDDVGACPKCGTHATANGTDIRHARQMPREPHAVLQPLDGLVRRT